MTEQSYKIKDKALKAVLGRLENAIDQVEQALSKQISEIESKDECRAMEEEREQYKKKLAVVDDIGKKVQFAIDEIRSILKE